MYYDFTVPIPVAQGKITCMKKGGIQYIQFETGRVYYPDRKYTIPQRVSIGKADVNHPGRMFPNEKYQEHFPDAAMPEERSEAYRSCALRIGSYVVIRKVLQEYKLPGMLRKYLGTDCGLFLDLVSFLIIEEENVGLHYPDFAFCHPLFSEGMRIYSDVKVSRLLNSIRREQMLGFLDDWNQNRDHRQRIYIYYDSTNKNCQAGNIDLVEYGKAKDERGLPVFNISLVFDKTNRLPLLYEEYPGSITDVTQLPFMVDKVREYGYRKIGFILDRGYFSKENIRYMEANHFAFMIMVRGRKKLVSSLVMEHRGTFDSSRDCLIRSYRIYGKTVQARLYEDDTWERYFHLYYNPARMAAEREQLEQQVEKCRAFLEKHIGEDCRFSRMYHEYFRLQYDRKGRLVSVQENAEAIEFQMKLCGYFCIVTSEPMTATEALVHYKGRDVSEKLFQADKSFIGANSMRTHSARALSAKIFAEFIALIVRNRIYNLLKETMLRIESRSGYLTVPKAIRELEKIEMVRRNNGQYRLDHAVTKKQKVILSSFGLAENDIRKAAAEIGQLLAKNQSLLPVEDIDADDETGEEELFDAESEIDLNH